jgi:hypothetical protein
MVRYPANLIVLRPLYYLVIYVSPKSVSSHKKLFFAKPTIEFQKGGVKRIISVQRGAYSGQKSTSQNRQSEIENPFLPLSGGTDPPIKNFAFIGIFLLQK